MEDDRKGMKKYPCKASVRVLAGHVPDLCTGLSVAGLLVPEAIAYSTIANLPPQTGVSALLAGLVACGLLGNSRFAIVSATSSSAAVLAAVAVGMAGDGLPMRMLVATGLVLITRSDRRERVARTLGQRF
jgi:MFS superfamily sulfate permease-like transporter